MQHAYRYHRVLVYQHLYSLAVQAGFYGDAVECLTSTWAIPVQTPAGSGPKNVSSPVTYGTQRWAFLFVYVFLACVHFLCQILPNKY